MPNNNKHLSFKDPNLFENELCALLDCKDTALFDQNDNEGYIYIESMVKIEYKDKCWGIYYCQEYGPLDKYIIFEMEQQAIFGYQYLKEHLRKKPLVFHEKDYPSSEILIGYHLTRLSKEFVKKFYNYVKLISDTYLSEHIKGFGDGNAISQNTKNENIKRFFSELKFEDYLVIETILEYVGYCNYMTLCGFKGDKSNLLCIYEENDLKIKMSENFDYKYNGKFKAEKYLELTDYLILVQNNQKYIVEKKGYLLVKYLVDKYNDPYEDGDEIIFFITDTYELIIYNRVFLAIQRAYIVDDRLEKVADIEISDLEKKLRYLKKEKYFDINKIISSFELLINSDQTKESQLEEFLKANFMVILGKKYSKIRTQVMVNFSSRGNQEERRFDVFAFNKASKEWELFELKKSNYNSITKEIRDIPMFNSVVNDGIAQLRYYRDLINQEHIRKSLKEKYEIDVGVPKFTLLIGSGNSCDIKKCQNQVTDIEVITYSQLIEMARIAND